MYSARLIKGSGIWARSARSLFQCALDRIMRQPTETKIPTAVRFCCLATLRAAQSPRRLAYCTGARGVHMSCSRTAGHNKWSKIKRKKAVIDLEKSKMRTKLMDQIRTAVAIGGSDPTTNMKLAGLLTQARSSGVPKSSIESALAGSGTGGAVREAVMYEGRGPSGYFVLIEVLTDNRKRTRPEIRHIIEKQGGILGEPGSSAFIFDQKAIIELSIDASNSSYTEDPMELAIEVGAEDVEVQNDAESGETEGRLIQLECGSSELSAVCAAVRERGLEVTSASVVYLPRSSVSLTPEQFEKAEKLVEMLSDQSDVVAVYSNHELA